MHTKKINIILFSMLFNVAIHGMNSKFFKNFKHIPKGKTHFPKTTNTSDSFKNVHEAFTPLDDIKSLSDMNPIDYLSIDEIGINIGGIADGALPEDFFASLFPSLFSSTTKGIVNTEVTGKFTEQLKQLSEEQKKSLLAKVLEQGKNLAKGAGQFVKEHQVAVGVTTVGVTLIGACVYNNHCRTQEAKKTKKELRKTKRALENSERNFNKKMEVTNKKQTEVNNKIDEAGIKGEISVFMSGVLENQYKNISINNEKMNNTFRDSTDTISKDLKEHTNKLNNIEKKIESASPSIDKHVEHVKTMKQETNEIKNQLKRLGIDLQKSSRTQELKEQNKNLKNANKIMNQLMKDY